MPQPGCLVGNVQDPGSGGLETRKQLAGEQLERKSPYVITVLGDVGHHPVKMQKALVSQGPWCTPEGHGGAFYLS